MKSDLKNNFFLKPFFNSGNIIFLMLLLLVLTFAYFFKRESTRMFVNNYKLTFGVINKINLAGRGNVGNFYVTFSFENDQMVVFQGSSTYSESKIDYLRIKNELIGHSFPVVYDSSRTSVSDMLIFPDDFTIFKIPFPDSLNWTKQYLKE